MIDAKECFPMFAARAFNVVETHLSVRHLHPCTLMFGRGKATARSLFRRKAPAHFFRREKIAPVQEYCVTSLSLRD